MFDTIRDPALESELRSCALMVYFKTLAHMSSELESFLLSGAFSRDLSVRAARSNDSRGWLLI